jgi:hypothetical protein
LIIHSINSLVDLQPLKINNKDLLFGNDEQFKIKVQIKSKVNKNTLKNHKFRKKNFIKNPSDLF